MRQSDEVRAAADIVKIVGDYVKLRKRGVNLVGLCPFHQEKTPSFAVHPARQIFHCFGCGAGGDVFKFVMLIEHLTFPEALGRVAEKAGITLRERPGDETFDAQARDRATLLKIHEFAAKFYAAQLGATAEGRAARGYLADRGLSDEVVGRFRLGYAQAHGQALTRHLTELGFDPAILEKSGLVLSDEEGKRRFDRFRRRVIFPIANESGKVVAFGGRALGDDQPKYLNSPETPIYTKSRVLYHLDRAAGAIRKADEVILVEGYMDCIAVASAGVERVVASCGTSLTESQIRLLSRYTRRVVVNYDPDSAGVAATERSVGGLLEEGFEVRVLALPVGLDPDAFIRQQGSAGYEERLAAAPGYIQYLTERAAGQHDLATPEGRVKAANAVLPHLAKVQDAMLRSQLVHALALRFRLDEGSAQEELKRAAAHRESQVRPQVASVQANHAIKQLLRACLESDELADELAGEMIESGDCEDLMGAGVFRRIADIRRLGERVDVVALEESLSPEERTLVYESLFWPGRPPNRELALGFRQALRVRKAQRDQERLQAEIERAERENDTSRLEALYAAKVQSARKLQEMGRPQKMLAKSRTN
ncbi:MAG TPA: DNA primase [Terriglobia bacterium]|nr:DNA primase [Terriglobia bacterium]